MDKGQSFGSADELQKRRKKKGALPLAVFLSFNDRDVNPQCPNASNPYHKCGWYCIDKIPAVNMLYDGERSGGSSSEWENMSENKSVNPSCPNASNPYHKCAEYCFGKITGKPQDAIKELGKNKGILTTGDESAMNPNCKYASNPYHRCDKFCFENNPVSDHRKGGTKPNEQKLVRAADRGVNSECKYASNPYHVCSEYCFQKVPERVQPGQAMYPKNLKVKKKIVNNIEREGVNPHCRFASNPFHKCSEFCFQNVAERDISDGAPIKKKNSGQRIERKADHSIMETWSLDSNSMEASNSSHNDTDSSKGITNHVGTNGSESVFIKEEKEASMIELLDSQPLRIDASDLFKEWAKYCSLKATEDDEAKTGKTGQR